MKHQPIEAVLFDMDGTLVDSEPLWHIADKAWLAGHGITLTADDWVHVVGLGGGPFVKMLIKEKGLKGDYDELLAEKNLVFEKVAATRSRPFPEMLKFAHIVKSRGLKTAIVSASSLSIICITLDCIGERALFDGLYSSEMVAHSKPDPMLYLYAAEQLGVAPENCLVMEDSQYGVEGGRRAGMTVVGVPYHIPEERRDRFDMADLLFSKGMEEFDSDITIGWLVGRGQLDP